MTCSTMVGSDGQGEFIVGLPQALNEQMTGCIQNERKRVEWYPTRWDIFFTENA